MSGKPIPFVIPVSRSPLAQQNAKGYTQQPE